MNLPVLEGQCLLQLPDSVNAGAQPSIAPPAALGELLKESAHAKPPVSAPYLYVLHV